MFSWLSYLCFKDDSGLNYMSLSTAKCELISCPFWNTLLIFFMGTDSCIGTKQYCWKGVKLEWVKYVILLMLASACCAPSRIAYYHPTNESTGFVTNDQSIGNEQLLFNLKCKREPSLPIHEFFETWLIHK